jgi:peptidyl-prolyl cis-trans isomerase C
MGAMVPPFDKAVFTPKNKVGEVLGPVQTQFGWHLILLVERDEQRSLIMD